VCVYVDEARCDNEVTDIYDASSGRAYGRGYLRDHITPNGHIRAIPRAAGAIDDATIVQNEIEWQLSRGRRHRRRACKPSNRCK
jgi:hypothetical protein